MINQPHLLILQYVENSSIYYNIVLRVQSKFLSIKIPQMLIIFLEILIISCGIYAIFNGTLSDIRRILYILGFFFCYLFLKFIITIMFIVADIDVSRQTNKPVQVKTFVFLANYYIFKNLYDNHDLEHLYNRCSKNKELFSELVKEVKFPKEFLLIKALE